MTLHILLKISKSIPWFFFTFSTPRTLKQCTALVEGKFQSTFFLQRRILLLFQPIFFYMYLNKFAYIYQCSFHQRKMYEKLSLFFILNVPKTWSRSEKSNLWVIKRTPLCITRSMYHFSSRHVMLVSDFLYYTANILTAQSKILKFCKQNIFAYKWRKVCFTVQKYCPPFSNKIFLIYICNLTIINLITM